MANQQDLLGQVAVEGAAEEQVVDEGAAVVQVVGEGTAEVQVDLGAADLEAVVKVHYDDQQGVIVIIVIVAIVICIVPRIIGGSMVGPSILLEDCKIHLPCSGVLILQIVV